MSREEWKEFFKTKKSVLVLLALAIVSSTLYVIYLERTRQLSKEMIEHYLIQKEVQFEAKHFITVFGVYFKRCMLVWVMGLFVFLSPLCLVLVFVYVFSYGFSIASLYVCFGFRGMWMGVITFGIQCMVMVSYLLHVEDFILKKSRVFEEMVPKSYLTYILIGSGAAFMTTLAEVLIITIV